MLALIGCSISSVENPETGLSVLKQLQEISQKNKSISYNVHYRFKRIGSNDTLSVRSRVDLIRSNTDTIIGAYVWIDEDTLSRVYDGTNVYIIDHVERLISQYPSGHQSALTENWTAGVIDHFFISPTERLEDHLDTLNRTSFETDSPDSFGHYVWRCEYPDEEPFSAHQIESIINKESKLVSRHSFSISFYGQPQYSQWDIEQQSFEEVTLEDFSERLDSLKGLYAWGEYAPSPEVQPVPLGVGDNLPRPTIVRYPDMEHDKIDFADQAYTLLDYWYMDCQPCLTAIEELNGISAHFRNGKINVIGLNPHNNNENDLDRLPVFLDHRPIDYPIAFITPQEAAQLPITAYPTIYLVDSDGVIVYSEVGYREGLLQRVDSVLSHKL